MNRKKLVILIMEEFENNYNYNSTISFIPESGNDYYDMEISRKGTIYASGSNNSNPSIVISADSKKMYSFTEGKYEEIK